MTFAARERDVDARALVVVCMDIPTPDDLRTEPRVTHVERTRDVLGKVIAQLRASRTLMTCVRAEPEVIADVARALRSRGWKCAIEKGGARDGGKTDGLTVRAPE